METESADLTDGIDNREICEPCKEQGHKRTAFYWCSDCPELLCENCYDHHKVLKATRNHKSLGIDEYRNIGANIADLDSNCKYHCENEIEFICLTHNGPCCFICKSELHGSECDVKTKDEILQGNDLPAKLKNTIQTINRLKDDVEKFAPIQGQSMSQLEEQRNLFYEELRSGREKVDQFLDTFEESVKRNFENVFASTHQRVIENIKILENKRLDLIQRRETAEKVLELGNFSDFKMYLMNSKFHSNTVDDQTQVKLVCNEAYNIISKPVFEVDEVSKVITLIDVIDNQSESKTREQVQCKSDNLDCSLSKTEAEIELSITSSTVEADEEPEMPSSTDVSEKNISPINGDEENTATAIETDSFELAKHFIIERRKKDINIRCARFLKEDKLVMTESSQYRILVYYTNGRKIGQVKVDKWPDEIAVLNCDEVAVACQKTLVFMDTNKMVLQGEKKFRDVIHGIGYAKEQIFVCLERKGMNVLDVSGNILRYIPFIRGTLYICATLNGCVFSAKNQTNTIFFSFCEESNVRDQYHLVNPLCVDGITCDKDNNIYLATTSPSIVKLDPTTKTFSTILSADDGLRDPYNVDYYKDSNQLLVIDEGKEVKIYTKKKNT